MLIKLITLEPISPLNEKIAHQFWYILIRSTQHNHIYRTMNKTTANTHVTKHT